MRPRLGVVLILPVISLWAVAACSGGGQGADPGGGTDAQGSPGATSSQGSAAASTSQSVPISGGASVTDGAASFDLPAGVAFVEAPARVVDDTAQRTWRFAPTPDDAQCVVTLTQQPRYTKPFPRNERQVLRSRVEQLEGGKVEVDESGAGPNGAPAGWLTHHTTPVNTAAGRNEPHSVWTRMFLTEQKGLVTLAAAATKDNAATCQIEAVVRSLSWTGDDVAAATQPSGQA